MIEYNFAAGYIVGSLKAVQLNVESGNYFVNQSVICQIVHVLEERKFEVVFDVIENSYNVDPSVDRICRRRVSRGIVSQAFQPFMLIAVTTPQALQ